MVPTSQIAWRNRQRLERAKRLLLIGPDADELPSSLIRCGHEVEVLSLSHGVHCRLSAAGCPSQFSLQPASPDSYDGVIVFQPREKALLALLLVLGASQLRPNAPLWLAGENRAGIKSAGSSLGSLFREWRKLDSARHCTLFEALGPTSEAPFAIQTFLKKWPLVVSGNSLTICGLPGVFAQGRVDAGTKLLIDTLLEQGSRLKFGGRVLDFACGPGTIGLGLAAAGFEISLTLLDDSLPAIESARLSMAENRVEGQLVASDGLTALRDSRAGRFDWIVSNPPFHSGIRQSFDTVRRFLADAPAVLARGGRLCLVANAHLAYGKWLSELFSSVQVIAADQGYNIWLASGPVGH